MSGQVKWAVELDEGVFALTAAQEAAAQEDRPLKILDIGGAIKPLVFATHVIDILPYNNRAWFGHIPGEASRGAERFSEETWFQHDICTYPWPFADDEFDIAWCTQTIEDVRDPLGTIKEMVRVSKVGYLQTIERNFESLHNVEDPRYAGYAHHKWLIERDGDKLKFTFKFPHIHTMPEYEPRQTGNRYIGLWWTGDLEAWEYVPMSREEIDTYFQSYVDGLNAQLGE